MIIIFGIQFYPTPPELVQKMLSKVDFSSVTYILEPSAGKGDIIEGISKYINNRKNNYGYYEKISSELTVEHFDTKQKCIDFINTKYDKDFTDFKEVQDYIFKLCDELENDKDYIEIHTTDSKLSKRLIEINCVEIDEDLREILKNKATIVGNDFLELDIRTQYDLIAMNPPFKDGDKHLLKALKMLENGGQCVCILNSETLKNPYSQQRQYLCNLLKRYNADIEYINSAFSNAENTTDVEVALVYVNIPKKEIELDVFKNLVLGENYEKKYEDFKDTQVATNDIVSNLVKQYEFESKAGIKIIDTFYSMQKYIPYVKDSKEMKMINLSVVGGNGDSIEISPINLYLRGLRDKYWSALFNSNEFSKLLTETVRNRFHSKLRGFRKYDFTFSNIKQLQIDISKNINENIETAILNQFDKFTYKYSLDNSTNVHYFNGWKTNDAFMIKSKVIVPKYDIYGRYGWNLYRANDFLSELEKIFIYLDGGRTEGDSYNTKSNEFYKNDYNGERISFKYFDVEFKKKGTIHIWFKDLELLKKFNIFGCQKHGWLPNCYGKKKYKDMAKEEQDVINEFEGEKEYSKITNNPSYYLGNNNLIQIETKEN